MIRYLLLLFLFSINFYAAEAHKTGSYKLTGLEEYAAVGHGEFPKRMGWGEAKGYFYKIQEETFEVFVPDNYTKDKPFGVVVWVNSGDGGGMPKQYKEIFKKHKLIWIGANKGGNKEDTRRRANLALDARHNIMKLYNIDPNRVYISGTSGGGKASSLTAFSFPTLFKGGIFCIGVAVWQRVQVPGGNSFWPSKFAKPIPTSRMKVISKEGRYALMTGDKDFNQKEIKAYYDQVFSKSLENCKYYQTPGLGHSRIPAEWYEKAIIQLDEPLKAIVKGYLTKARQLLKSKKYLEAAKLLQLAAANDVAEAQVELEKLQKEVEGFTVEAAKLLKEESYYLSYVKYKKIVDVYGAFATSASEQYKLMLSDKDLKMEVSADGLLYRAQLYFDKKDKVNFKKYANALVKKYPNSKAATKAKERWIKKK
jgi:hypothetical protein